MSVELELEVREPGINRGREWLAHALLSAVWRVRRARSSRAEEPSIRGRAARKAGLHEITVLEQGVYYVARVLQGSRHREQEILRLAEVLRALERRVDKINRPCTTPAEVHRALEDVRHILRSTGKPWPGRCARCGTVAMRSRARVCPVCGLTEPDGVERSKGRRWRRRWW